MRFRTPTALIAIAACAALATPASAASHHHKATVRTFSGTIAAVSKDRTVVRLKRSGKKSSVRFTVTRSTKVTGTASRSTLAKGPPATITAVKTKRGWTARKIVVAGQDGADPNAVDPNTIIPNDQPGAGGGGGDGNDDSDDPEAGGF